MEPVHNRLENSLEILTKALQGLRFSKYDNNQSHSLWIEVCVFL